MRYYYLLLIINLQFLTITLLFSISTAFGQLEIPSKFSTFTNEEYSIQLQYPSEWQIFGDVEAGDYANTSIPNSPPTNAVALEDLR